MNMDFKQTHEKGLIHISAATGGQRRPGDMRAVLLEDQFFDADQIQGIKQAIQESIDQAFGASN